MSYSILIVDDNEAIRRQLRLCLERKPNWFVCGEAVNGLDALEKNRELKPDLIILDLSMPVMNGFDAARALKLSRPAVPLLMFTSFKNPVLEKQAVALGCAAVLSKSDSPQLLLDSVERLLVAAV